MSFRSTPQNGTDELEKPGVGVGAILDLTSPPRSVAILDASIPDTHLSVL